VARSIRVLEALAHLTLHLSARLSLHPPGRQPAWRIPDLSQPHAHHAHRWALARCGLDVRGMGRVSWRTARALQALRQAMGSPESWHAPGGHVRPGRCRLGALSLDVVRHGHVAPAYHVRP